jgi:hypothetical protein
MSSNTQKVVKIVSILIIGGLFIGFMMWLRNSMKTNCGSGDEFSKDLNKCIPKCTGNTVYDDTKGKCVSKCNSTQIECNGNCYENTVKCMPMPDGNGEVACGVNDIGLCGTQCNPTNKTCVNVNGVQTLVNNDDPKLCNKNTTPTLCDEGKLCDTSNGDTCITCASGNVCGKNCCDPGIACDSNDKSKCGVSCSNVCGKGLCCKDTDKCIGDECKSCGNISISNCEFCNNEAYDKTTTFCDVTATCPLDKTFTDEKGKQRCCDGEVAGGKCCSKQSQEVAHEGKCMIQCQDENDKAPINLYCDPSKNQVCAKNDNSKGTNKYYCQTVNCRWTQIDYLPQDFQIEKDSKTTYPICSYNDKNGGATKYYITKQPGLPLSRIVYTNEFSDNKCQANDCVSRLAEDGLTAYNFGKKNPDDKNHCEGIFDCNKILKYNLEDGCPFLKDDGQPDVGRCCTSGTGTGTNFTGQVCEKGKVCINGNCFTPSFKCSVNGQCVEYGLDDLDDPNVAGKYTDGKCNSECVAAPSPITTYAPCGWYEDQAGQYQEPCIGGFGSGAEQAYRVCKNFQKGTFNTYLDGGPPPAQSILNRNDYTWSCLPNFDNNGKVINVNHDPSCTCIPSIKTCDIYQDADRKRLPKDNICYMAP